MLTDFYFFGHLPERGTISGTIFTGDANLFGSLGLQMQSKEISIKISKI